LLGMGFSVLLSLLAFSFCVSLALGQLCSGWPPTYNGLPCASTTVYYDGSMGACGCAQSWNYQGYTAAGSDALFGAGSTWCGSGCGLCYLLTATGASPPGQGTGGPAGSAIVAMITNLCPYQGNEMWCPQAGTGNAFGYPAHFDLQNQANQIYNLGWNNPEVTYQQVDCNAYGGLTPNTGEFDQCQCANTAGPYGGCAVTGTPGGFQWNGGSYSSSGYWLAFSLSTSQASINCGQGNVGMQLAGWQDIPGVPVWFWAGNYQCGQTAQVNWDGGSFCVAVPGR